MTLDRRVYEGVCLALTSMVLLCGIACAPAVRVAPLPPQWCAASTSTPGRVTACASADSESVADDRAFAQITRQLSQEVAVRETMTSGEEAQREANGQRVTRSFASYSENVQAVALARLLGARVEQRAQVGSTYYALASLDLRQVTRRVSAATDDALAFAARGDVVRALGSCREARRQARLLPVLFAEVDANVGRCQTLSEALYERLSVTVVADTLLRVHYEGRPVARLRVRVRRAGAATTPTILGESDELGFVRRVRPFPMVSGGALHEEFDVVWDGLDDLLETRPYRARAQQRTEFPGRSVSVNITGDLPPDDEAKLLAALRREFGEAGPSSAPGAIWIVKLSARIRNEESSLSGVRSASVTINWQLASVGSGAPAAQGGVVDQRAVGITDADAHTAVVLRSAVRVAADLERALVQAELWPQRAWTRD